MSERNPYGEAFDASRHVEPDENTQPTPYDPDDTDEAAFLGIDSPEADFVHLKVPGGALVCGTMPHGVTSTLSEDSATCPGCQQEMQILRDKINS